MSDTMRFTFSDTIAGAVTGFDPESDSFGLQTADGREFDVALTDTTYAELLRNLGEPYVDATGQMRDMLAPGRFLFAYGVFYPEGERHSFEAKHLVFVGRTPFDYMFEQPDWWITQVRSLAEFYLRAQFGEGEVDYRNYRTVLTLEGYKPSTHRQETDTISRLVYGFATAYLLTGEDRFLNAAERGVEYLRDHMRIVDLAQGIACWVHGIDVSGDSERKVMSSEFGDDIDAIPAYEQIYAMCGPAQTYRVTGDPRIIRDVEMTHELFNRFFLDPDEGGFYSHVDPITFNPHAEVLGRNRSCKNWNSVGDHAPAYLINVYLATGEERFADFLALTADTIVERFPDYDNSPFVNERFHRDWSPDHEWGWQQNRAVVGHNLKIAWNLMRIQSVRPNPAYVELAEHIAEVMPPAGSDLQRGGWYDVVERELGDGQEWHRFTWHDRKAWWQQEQAILAYLILAGTLDRERYLYHARNASAFYNAWFLDHDAGGVYFNVLANGLPYLLGTERFKGSHSMSGYHAFELCYLAAVYTNLLVMSQPLDLYFKPKADGFKDGMLRVAPDLLPPGSVRLEAVWVDDRRYDRFDPEALTVTLPPGEEVRVRVRLVPTMTGERVEEKVPAAETVPAS
ncbi:MAG TPA: AGE family epimerase/isomerase [Gaiellaceae bacterium]|jgi:mannose/cellobiose epimerase-like protein (N-acyl-D-glucosamine 2-epimerase family)|nr:AGE family epimerase/isomerase [Gaiellaceae bacterium]